MSVFQVRQIRISREQYDLINKLGWAAMTKPEHRDFLAPLKAKQDLTFEGAGAFTDDMIGLFVPSFNVEAENLEEVFRLTNLWDDMTRVERLQDRAHSTSVGDLIVDMSDGTVWFVDMVGFKNLGTF